MTEERVDDVNYFIRQKPKCAVTADDGQTLTGPTATGEIIIGDNASTTEVVETSWIDCGPAPRELEEDESWDVLPSLCPYISKEDDQSPDNDGSTPSFHQPWTVGSTTVTWLDTLGRLAKSEQDTEDNWTIDLAVPCFGGSCAQDWANFVTSVNPAANPDEFTQPIENEHKIFGCDLWVEVLGVSTSTSTEPTTQTLTVNKVVVNDDDGTATTTDFSFTLDGGSAIAFEADGSNVMPVSAGAHIVAEPAVAGYTATFSGDCDATGNVTVATSSSATCTITNDDNPAEVGSLTVVKVITNDDGGVATVGNFSLFVGGTGVTSSTTTAFAPGSYIVTETGVAGYAASFGGDCDSSGNVTLVAGDNKICTVTNNDIPPTITLNKEVINDNGGTATPASFTLRVDGIVVPNGTSIQRDANTNISITEDPLAGYTSTGITGTGCPATLGELFTMDLAESITCTVTNDDNPPAET